MDERQVPLVVGESAEAVVDADRGVEQRLVLGMQPTGDVHVLHVHEEAFVEDAFGLQCADSEEHEAAGQEGHVHLLVVARMPQLEAVVPAGKESLGHEEPAEEVERRGQQFGKSLHRTVEEEHFRHHLCYAVVVLHQPPERRYHFCAEPHIRVDDEVVLAPLLHRFAKGHIMAAAIALVFLLDVVELEASALVPQEFLVAALVLQQLVLQPHKLVAVVYDPHFLDGRYEQAAKDAFQVQEVIVICYYRRCYHASFMASLDLEASSDPL